LRVIGRGTARRAPGIQGGKFEILSPWKGEIREGFNRQFDMLQPTRTSITNMQEITIGKKKEGNISVPLFEIILARE